MSIKTKSEKLFESFLQANGIRFDEIEQAETPRPDYLVHVGNAQIIFEIKELSEDENFGVADPEHPHIRSFNGIPGDHVRRRIELSKRQIQYGAKQGIPSVLLIYNNLDTAFQMFGTADHDFTAAMCGELTILIDKQTRIPSEMFHGRNQLLQKNKNTSFSAVGHLSNRGGEMTVKLFENAFALVKLPFEDMPPCLEVVRVQIDDAV